TVRALHRLKAIAVEMRDALLEGDLEAFGALLRENWENQKALHPSVTNPQIERLFAIALAEGAIGGKALGAGGGGCLLFYCRSDREHAVRQALAGAGAQPLSFHFDFKGLQVWTAP
ncbi:MAG TPA: GHMP kinase, partial [Anaerolineae bacterium]|nr:GHMP kinase [Anaerolineae bacterium]